MVKIEIQTDKKTYIIIAIFVLVAGIICWDVFGRDNISSDRDRINEIRSDLRSVEQQQQSAIDGLAGIENGLDDSAATIGRISDGISNTTKSIATVENRIDSSQAKLADSSGLIAEGKRIVRQIRTRGQVGN